MGKESTLSTLRAMEHDARALTAALREQMDRGPVEGLAGRIVAEESRANALADAVVVVEQEGGVW